MAILAVTHGGVLLYLQFNSIQFNSIQFNSFSIKTTNTSKKTHKMEEMQLKAKA